MRMVGCYTVYHAKETFVVETETTTVTVSTTFTKLRAANAATLP
jgi:hypothetical protein